MSLCFVIPVLSWNAGFAGETSEGHAPVRVLKELNEVLKVRNSALPVEEHVVFRIVFDRAGDVPGSTEEDFVRYLIYYRDIGALRGRNNLEFDVHAARIPGILERRKNFDAGALRETDTVIEICLGFANRGETPRNAVYLFRYLSDELAKICSFPAEGKALFDGQVGAMMEKFQAGRTFESENAASAYPRWFLSASKEAGDPDGWQFSLMFVLEESI